MNLLIIGPIFFGALVFFKLASWLRRDKGSYVTSQWLREQTYTSGIKTGIKKV